MEPPPSPYSVAILNQSGRRTPRALISSAISSALAVGGAEPGEVSVFLCDDDAIRELNRTYRGIDEPTDVLTFPSNDVDGAPIGDIAISVPYAERQASARGVSLNQEIGYLAIHGALHLLGYDDESEADRSEMVRQMNKVAAAAGLQPDENWASLLHEGVAR
jgi:rRNA maturation RNase YbeY